MHMAIRYHVYAEHEDLMDIVGVGNLAVAANVDKALTKLNPVSFSYNHLSARNFT